MMAGKFRAGAVAQHLGRERAEHGVGKEVARGRKSHRRFLDGYLDQGIRQAAHQERWLHTAVSREWRCVAASETGMGGRR